MNIDQLNIPLNKDSTKLTSTIKDGRFWRRTERGQLGDGWFPTGGWAVSGWLIGGFRCWIQSEQEVRGRVREKGSRERERGKVQNQKFHVFLSLIVGIP